MCHMSRVMWYMYMSYFEFVLEKVVKLVGGGSVINGATSSSYVYISINKII